MLFSCTIESALKRTLVMVLFSQGSYNVTKKYFVKSLVYSLCLKRGFIFNLLADKSTIPASLTVSKRFCKRLFVWLHQVNERDDLFDTSFIAPLHLCGWHKRSHDSAQHFCRPLRWYQMHIASIHFSTALVQIAQGGVKQLLSIKRMIYHKKN